MNRRVFALPAAVAALAVSISAAVAQPVTIKIGTGATGLEQLELLKAKPALGQNQDKLYSLDFVAFRGTDARFKAYEAGQLDAFTGSGSAMLVAAAAGIEFKIVASLSKESARGYVTQFLVTADSPIKTAADLKGKLIGINGFKSSIELYARIPVQAAGLDPERDVKWAVVPFPAQGQALRSGKLDVGAFPLPFSAIEHKKGGVRTLFTSHDAMPFDRELIVLAFNEQFLVKNGAAVRALLADLVAATRYYVANLRASRQALIDAKMTQIDADVLLDMEDWYRDPDCRVDVESLSKEQDAQVAAGMQKGRADLGRIVDTGYLPK
jgi:ABC-type nitrate/sulfonate/bicarbonate transport system substrate-binding protein